MQAGVRDLQVFLVDLGLTEEQEVEVECPRALGRGSRPVTAVAGLHGEEEVEQLAGRERGLEGGDALQESGVGEGDDGRCLEEGGDGAEAQPRWSPEDGEG